MAQSEIDIAEQTARASQGSRLAPRRRRSHTDVRASMAMARPLSASNSPSARPVAAASSSPVVLRQCSCP